MIYNTFKNLLETNDLYNYLSSDLINELYFKPKKVDRTLIDEKLKDLNYLEKYNNTITQLFKNVGI